MIMGVKIINEKEFERIIKGWELVYGNFAAVSFS